MLILLILAIILFIYILFFDYDFLLNYGGYVPITRVLNILEINDHILYNFYSQWIDQDFERRMLEGREIFLAEEEIKFTSDRNLFLAKSLFFLTLFIFLITLNSTFKSG